MKDKTVPERLAVIETEITHIKESFDDIKDNHLHSISNKFDAIWGKINGFERKLTNRLPAWAMIIITFLSSLVIGLIVYGVMRK